MKRQFKVLAVTAFLAAFASCKSTAPVSEPESVPVKTENREPRQGQGQVQGDRKRPSPEMLIQKMDTNKDGKISKLEAKGKLLEDFQRKDANNDGFITKDELVKKER